MRYQHKIFKNFSFLFALLFIAIFLGVILSILISYLSSLFYNAYKIRDNQSWYFMSLARDVRSKNKNQPLLGFTLLPVLFLLCFSGFVAFESIPNNVFDLDFKFNIPTQKEILEDENTLPILTYSRGKVNNEELIKNSGKKYVILRLGSVYGYSTDTTRLDIMPNLFSKLASQNKTIKLFSGGKQIKSVVSLIDVVRCMKFMEESKKIKRMVIN